MMAWLTGRELLTVICHCSATLHAGPQGVQSNKKWIWKARQGKMSQVHVIALGRAGASHLEGQEDG